MDNDSYSFSQISNLITLAKSFGTDREIEEFCKTVPHMISLKEILETLSKSNMKADVTAAETFVKYKESFQLTDKINEMKATLNIEQQNCIHDDGVIGDTSTPNNNLPASSSSTSKSLKRKASDNDQLQSEKKLNDQEIFSIGKSINEWDDEEFIKTAQEMYSALERNPYRKKGGMKTAILHYLVYICLRLLFLLPA